MAKILKINARIIEQLAKATVKNLIDGLVELITNSDDSYKRLEQAGHSVSGEIEIIVERKKGGICTCLQVRDKAEGMTREELEKAIEFAGETSGIEEGKSVRGMFGRGLKETIIALGEGEIISVKNGKRVSTKIYIDKNTRQPSYDDEMLDKVTETIEQNGTVVSIKVTNEKFKIPELDKFEEQLTNHFALRDINSDNNRKIKLIFRDLKRRAEITKFIKYHKPQVKLILNKALTLSDGDKIDLRIYESQSPLSFQKYDPSSLAGILIKTKSAILDNQLFKFENEPAAYYFCGEAICHGLEERLRRGQTELIDPNRAGIEWKHDYCQEMASLIQRELEPFILKKKHELEKKIQPKEIKEPTKKMLRKLCGLLNEIAKKELDEFPEDIKPAPYINDLQIKPEVANIEVNKPRTFSVYAPVNLVEIEGNHVRISSDNTRIRLLSSPEIILEPHPIYSDNIYYKYFKIIGDEEGTAGNITAHLGNEKAVAQVKVSPPKKRKRGELKGKKGGFIKDIQTDELSDPATRSEYIDGIIKIYINFPSVAKYIRSGLDGVESEAGRAILAELIGETFCRALARKGIELGKYHVVPGSEIDGFIVAINEIQKKYLHLIHELIEKWKFK